MKKLSCQLVQILIKTRQASVFNCATLKFFACRMNHGTNAVVDAIVITLCYNSDSCSLITNLQKR